MVAAAAALAVVAPASTSRAAPQGVPILMYHVIAAAPAGAPYPGLYVTPADFAAQVAWLARHGYHAVTLRAVYDHWTRGALLPSRPVVLTFDDGYRSDWLNALPVLRARRWPGVLNLEVRNETYSWGMSKRGVRRLLAAGWEVDAHTLTHPDLTKVDPVQLRREVGGSREVIRSQFHVPVDFFCYPAGRYDARVIAAVRAAGFLGATTTDYGLATPANPFALRRVRVDGSDGARGLAAKLTALEP